MSGAQNSGSVRDKLRELERDPGAQHTHFNS
jgi:hypothetical protein